MGQPVALGRHPSGRETARSYTRTAFISRIYHHQPDCRYCWAPTIRPATNLMGKISLDLRRTSAPVCILIPCNSWGAIILALLTTQVSLETLGGLGALAIFVSAMAFNFYAILSILLAFTVATTGLDFGPMRCTERQTSDKGQLSEPIPSPSWPTTPCSRHSRPA